MVVFLSQWQQASSKQVLESNMELNAVSETLKGVSKKRRLSYTKSADMIEYIRKEIEVALDKLQNTSDMSTIDLKVIIASLNTKLNTLGLTKMLAKSRKDVTVALTRYGKELDKQFHHDMTSAQWDVEFDEHRINRNITSYFYRQGLFELGDCFVSETSQAEDAFLKATFVNLHEILKEMKTKNLEPALAWGRAHHNELLQKQSALELKLHGLQYIKILQNGSQMEALEYARQSFPAFAKCHLEKLQKFMGCLLWADHLENSPYSELLSDCYWESISLELAQEYYGRLSQSYRCPLFITISAGCQALPTLLKLANLMAHKREEWLQMTELPLEIELDREFQFHSVFVCPVTREPADEDNPPMLLPCFHVLCKQSILSLSRNNTRPFKCPYCPSEVTFINCKQIYL